jgi:fumarylacetoacetase
MVATGNPMPRRCPLSRPRTTSSAGCSSTTWSARDLQTLEYVPLGPNLGKSVLPRSALRGWCRSWRWTAARVDIAFQEPPVLPYLALERPWGRTSTSRSSGTATS